MWPAVSNGDDINSVDVSPDGQLLASADDFGRVKVFKYPCNSSQASYLKFSMALQLFASRNSLEF
jgi:echinoderm microtubule-associated protein-like 5